MLYVTYPDLVCHFNTSTIWTLNRRKRLPSKRRNIIIKYTAAEEDKMKITTEITFLLHLYAAAIQFIMVYDDLANKLYDLNME